MCFCVYDKMIRFTSSRKTDPVTMQWLAVISCRYCVLHTKICTDHSLCICGVFSHLYIHCSVQQPVTEGTAQCCPGDLSGGGRCSPAGMTVWPPFPYNWLPPLGQEGVSSQVMWTPRFSGVGRECLCLQQTLPVECLLQAQLLY